jgi:hypothetical protein
MMNMLLRVRSLLFCIFILVALTSMGVCAELESEAHEKEGDHRNKVSLFGGNTQDGSENGASIGLEYEYRLNPRLGIGGLGEYAGGDFDSWVIGIPVFIHPHGGWVLFLAPGLEFEDSETNLLFRVGSGYEFELMPRWSLAPEINVDFADGDTKLVYGLTLSWEF